MKVFSYKPCTYVVRSELTKEPKFQTTCGRSATGPVLKRYSGVASTAFDVNTLVKGWRSHPKQNGNATCRKRLPAAFTLA